MTNLLGHLVFSLSLLSPSFLQGEGVQAACPPLPESETDGNLNVKEHQPPWISCFAATPEAPEGDEEVELTWTVDGNPTSLILTEEPVPDEGDEAELDEPSEEPEDQVRLSVLGLAAWRAHPSRRAVYTLWAQNPAGQAQARVVVLGRSAYLGILAGGTTNLRYPRGGVLDPNRNLYVADTANHTIVRVGRDGTTTVVAGGPGTPGYVNGPAANARFRFPTDIARDGAGNLYVTDSENRTIRKITPAGVVSTLAGSELRALVSSRQGRRRVSEIPDGNHCGPCRTAPRHGPPVPLRLQDFGRGRRELGGREGGGRR